MKTFIIIPSRYHSVRLPQKPLAKLAGITMVERVYRQCKMAEGVDAVYVATDHQAIVKEVERFGGDVIETSPDSASGTDRVAEAAQKIGIQDAIIVNVQGDEPLIEPTVISALVRVMKEDPGIMAATPISRIREMHDLTSPNVVKVVRDSSGNALYFSRQTIPFLRDAEKEDQESWLLRFEYFKHIGVYAYRMQTLRTFVSLPESPLELAERLEQLRLLQDGLKMRCVEVEYDSIAVDVPEDITRVESVLAERSAIA